MHGTRRIGTSRPRRDSHECWPNSQNSGPTPDSAEHQILPNMVHFEKRLRNLTFGQSTAMPASKLIKIGGLIFWLLCLPALAALPASTNEFLITRNSIGIVRLGQTKNEVLKIAKEKGLKVNQVDLLLEGLPSPALDLLCKNELLITAELDKKGKIYRISTRSSKFHTPDGIRVGSTFGEAKRHLTRLVVDDGEDGAFAISTLPAGTISLSLNWLNSLNAPPDETKIVNILVVK